MLRNLAIPLLLSLVTTGVAAPSDSPLTRDLPASNRFEDIFSPFVTDAAALSPDGRLLAYSRRDGEQLAIIVVEVDEPSVARARVIVNTDTKATPYLALMQEKMASRILWMRWVNSRRVVFQTNWGHDGAAVLSFDFDGKSERILATRHTSEVFNSGARIIDVSPTVEGAVLIETSGVRAFGARFETDPENYRLESSTGKFHRISTSEVERERKALRELRDEMRTQREAVRAELEKVFPGKAIDLIENRGDGDRWLARVEDAADPGGFYVFDRKRGKLWEFCRRLPALDGARVPGTTRVKFSVAEGEPIRGVVTFPRKPMTTPTPAVVLMPRLHSHAVSREFRREVFALSEMGVAVVQFDGFAADGAAGANDTERERKQLDRLLAVMAGANNFPALSLRRAVLPGEGSGGVLALQALRTQPDLIRGVIAIEPLAEIPNFRDHTPWVRASPDSTARQTVRQPRPILLLHFERPSRAMPDPVKPLAKNWRDAGSSVEMVPLTIDYLAGAPRATADVFRKIEPFLLEHLLDFGVRVGESKPVAP